MSTLPKIFRNYLVIEGYSPVTVRNYLSDLNHFLAWLELRLRSRNLPFSQNEIESISQHFTPQTVEAYKNFLFKNHLPVSTSNRRLSTIRCFAKFCLSQNWISQNPTKGVRNKPAPEEGATEILARFKKALEAEKTSSNTIKSYLSDINTFLTWLELST